MTETLLAMIEVAYELRWWLLATFAVALVLFLAEVEPPATGTAMDLERERVQNGAYLLGYKHGQKDGYREGYEHGRRATEVYGEAA